MGTSITTAMPEPQIGAEGDRLTLSQFLRLLVSDGSCFCCGCPTELMLDGSGLLFVRCPACGAEISAEETAYAAKAEPVLQAA
jgi:predicted amidophosphoribosyltransferase